MKKKFIYVFIFLFSMFLFTSRVEAKYISDRDIEVKFGNQDNFYMGYNNTNIFSLDEYNKFYYNGVEYTFTSQDKEKGYIKIGEETLTNSNDNKTVLESDKYHDFYELAIEIKNNSKNDYLFTQKICFKTNKMDQLDCKEDILDKIEIKAKSNSIRKFFYGFLPFYDKDIVFEKLFYDLTFTNVKDSSDVITFNNFGFDTLNGKDKIYLKDNLNFEMIRWKQADGKVFNSDNEGKDYLADYCLRTNVFGDLAGQEVCLNNLLYITLENEFNYSSSSNDLNKIVTRDYKISYNILYGDNYSNVYSISNSEIKSIFKGFNGFYLSDEYKPNLDTIHRNRIYLPLPILEYNTSTRTAKYDSFKIQAKYSCVNTDKSDCSDPRSQSEGVYEDIIYLNLGDFKDNSKNSNGTYFKDADLYGTVEDFKYHVDIDKPIGIKQVGYYLSDKLYYRDIYDQLEKLEFTNINNKEDLILPFIDQEVRCLYLKIIDNAGRVDYTYLPIKIAFDSKAPEFIDSNFNDYLNKSYSDINLKPIFQDFLVDNKSLNLTGYYLIVSEERINTVTIKEVIDSNNIYKDGASINKNTITKSGRYLVYFVFKDALNNTSELIASPIYDIDIDPLTNKEVESNIIEGYTNKVDITVSIDQLEEGVSFKCDLSKTTITDPLDLKNNCLNKKEKNISINNEGIYYLWIYASDEAGNYSLIKLDNPYYIDTLAPRVSSSVTSGDNNKYSNDVRIKVSAVDLNKIDENNSFYQFYKSSYDVNKFIKFDLNKEITYPYDYYGDYYLAIKVCDEIGNCKINTFDDTYLIDTSKIIVKLNGKDNLNILRFQNYKDPGITITKHNQVINSNDIDYLLKGKVDNNTPGTYTITYQVGKGINQVSITRTIIVKDSMPYIYALIGLFVIGEVIILARLFIKKRKNDTI